MKLYVAIAIGLVCGAPAALAQQVDWQHNRLVPLSKVTAGPWDNFEATVTDDDGRLFYTRTANQVAQILEQDLTQYESRPVLPQPGDAKDPALDIHGTRLAFTFYGRDAQGDVCLLRLGENQFDCLTDTSSMDELPFWVDATHLGFLTRSDITAPWQLVIVDLTSKQRQVVQEGALSAPVASHDGRYVVFHETDAGGAARMRVYDRQTDVVQSLPAFDLPGISGYMAFADDGLVYFNHYLNDTNGDQTIDANDHSVVFRMPFRRWIEAAAPILPEQLTSVTDNCKFPAVSAHSLYLTCAFEGTLDIYRLPLSGAVPSAWNAAQLWEAHRIARSYEARLLILNTLRYRQTLNDTAMLERLLSNHLALGELTAARYYVEQLRQRGSATDSAAFYQALALLLDVKSAKQRVPVGLVTARFQAEVAGARAQLSMVGGRPQLAALMEAYLAYELEEYVPALRRLDDVGVTRPAPPLERYLALDLYRALLEDRNPRRLATLYTQVFDDTALSADARIYYALQYLRLLGRTTDTAPRIEQLQQTIAGTADTRILSLLRAEVLALQLAATGDSPAQAAAFKSLSEHLKAHQSDALLRQAAHTRAIQILGDAEQFQPMELLSRHWLVSTQISEMEFYHVAEQFSLITLEKAYGLMADNDLAKAYATFYSAIRQTGDLEAHYQFVVLGLTPSLDRREHLNQAYAALEKDKLLGGSSRYVQALRLLLSDDEKKAARYDQALSLLGGLDSRAFNPAVRELLLGYVYHQKLRLSQRGYHYDQGLFQKAHHHYMMAFDLARDNNRILAAAWGNLAALHFEVRNYGLSASFYAQRTAIPFASAQDESYVRYAYARALYYNDDFAGALAQAERVLTLQPPGNAAANTPFIEKVAFYALQAGDYAKAAQYYDVLLQSRTALDPANLAKALLGLGRAQRQLGRIDQARTTLTQAIAAAVNAKGVKEDERLLDFYPERVQWLAYGLLAELSTDPGQIIESRNARVAQLNNIKGKARDYGYDEALRLSLITKDYHHIAVAYERKGEIEQAASAWHEALQYATLWVKETEDKAGPVIYRTLVNYLSAALSHPTVFRARHTKSIDGAVNDAINAWSQQTLRSPVTVAQQTKLALLWQAYQGLVVAKNAVGLATRLDSVFQVDEVQHLAQTAPLEMDELRHIAAGLKALAQG